MKLFQSKILKNWLKDDIPYFNRDYQFPKKKNPEPWFNQDSGLRMLLSFSKADSGLISTTKNDIFSKGVIPLSVQMHYFDEIA